MLNILLIGAGLSMDAFAVSVTNGLTTPGYRLRHAALDRGVLRLFPGPDAAARLAAGQRGQRPGQRLGAVHKLFPAGLHRHEDDSGGRLKGEGRAYRRSSNPAAWLLMAVATSLDALAAGVSFAFMDVPLPAVVLLIAAVTFAVCFAGGVLGSRVPAIPCRAAGILGGAVLCGIGAKLLLEGIGAL